VIVNFDYENWAVLYPQLAAYTNETQADAFFAMAQLWLRNDGCSPVCSPLVAQQLYNLLVAHLAQLNLQSQRANGAPGRIGSATMGSVSIGLNYPDLPNAAWFTQTTYGASYWDATKPYRRMYYLPGPVPAVDPWHHWLHSHAWTSHGIGCGCGCGGRGVWVDGVSIVGDSRSTPLSAGTISGGIYNPSEGEDTPGGLAPPPEPPTDSKRKRIAKLLKLLLKDQLLTHEQLRRIEAGDFGDITGISLDDLDLDADDDDDDDG